MSATIADHIACTPGVLGGKPRIAGTRIGVAMVHAWHTRLGLSVDQIVEHYDGITHADIHAALAYYYDHREEIEERERVDEEGTQRFIHDNPDKVKFFPH